MAFVDFAENLRQAREARGFSIREFSRITGIATSTISRWETGKNLPGNYKTWDTLGKVLNITPELLIGLSDPLQLKKQLDQGQCLAELKTVVQLLEGKVQKLAADIKSQHS